MAFKKHVRLARLEGGALGVGGAITAAPDMVALLWIQSRMVFYIAAAYGYDPLPPDAPGRVPRAPGPLRHPAPRRARRSTAWASGWRRRWSSARLSGRRTDALHLRLAKYIARRLARRYAGRLIPFIGAPIGAIQNGNVTRQLGRARAELLRAPVDRDRRAARDRRVVRDEEAHDPRDLRRLDPLRVVGVRLRRAVGGRVDHARQDRVRADALACGSRRRAPGRTRAPPPSRSRRRRRPRTAAAPARADTATNEPPPRSSSRGIAARARLKAGARLSRSIRSKSSQVGLVHERAREEAADEVHDRLEVVHRRHRLLGSALRIDQVGAHERGPVAEAPPRRARAPCRRSR